MPGCLTAMTAILVMTRRLEDARAFVAKVEAGLGRPLAVIYAPAFEIGFLEVEMPQGAMRPVFTSRNGVEAAVRLRVPVGPAWCVGHATATRAAEAGYQPMGKGGDVDSLVRQIIASGETKQLVHVRGAHTRGDLANRLTQAGLNCSEVIAYRQVPQAPTAELMMAWAGQDPLLFPFFSPRSTLILPKTKAGADLYAVAMSDAVANALERAKFQEVVTTAEPTQQAMIAETISQLAALNHERGTA